MDKERKITIFLCFVIVISLGIIFYLWNGGFKTSNTINSDSGLLSPRIYSGLLKQESYLIFNLKPLEESIKNYVKQNNLNASIYVISLRDGASFGINEEAPTNPASLNKLPLAMIIMKDIDEGEYNLDTVVDILPEDKNSKSGTLYKEDINQLSVDLLLKYMLSRSDNTAFYTLLRKTDAEEIKKISYYLDFFYTPENYSQNEKPYITAKSTYNLFQSLYLSTFLKKESSEYILSLLVDSKYDIKKYAGLPNNITVAHKYGAYYENGEKVFNDCGIIYSNEKRFFYCVMINGKSEDESAIIVGKIVHAIDDYINTLDKQLKNIDF